MADDSKGKMIESMSKKFGVGHRELWDSLKNTAFKQKKGDPETTDAEMMALLVVANQHNLNPFTREIYAFRTKSGGIMPMIGIDGWIKIANQNPLYDGVEFRYAEQMIAVPGGGNRECHEWVEAVIHVKGRGDTVVREYFDECFQPGGFVWPFYPKRFLRHRAFGQGVRLALGLTEFHDESDVIDMEPGTPWTQATTKPVDDQGRVEELTSDLLARLGYQEMPPSLDQFIRDSMTRFKCDREKVLEKALADSKNFGKGYEAWAAKQLPDPGKEPPKKKPAPKVKPEVQDPEIVDEDPGIVYWEPSDQFRKMAASAGVSIQKFIDYFGGQGLESQGDIEKIGATVLESTESWEEFVTEVTGLAPRKDNGSLPGM